MTLNPMRTISQLNKELALHLDHEQACVLSQLLVVLGRLTEIRCPVIAQTMFRPGAVGCFADIWDGGQRTRVFSVSLVQALSEAVADVPDTLAEFLAAVGQVADLARKMKAASAGYGQCASDMEVFDRYRLSGACRNYARRLLRAIGSALPTLVEANGKLGQPSLMVAVAEIAKARHPAIVNCAGRVPTAS